MSDQMPVACQPHSVHPLGPECRQQRGREGDSAEPQVYVVCSPTAAHTAAWRRERGLPCRRVIHAGSPARIVGMRNFEVVYLPGFELRRDAARIRTVVDDGLRRMAASRAVAGS